MEREHFQRNIRDILRERVFDCQCHVQLEREWLIEDDTSCKY